jgi:tRNA nucleotidyltransferase (CCA-adding enzyme)
MTVRKAEFGFGGDAYPASQPQYEEDHKYDRIQHDEPGYEPGSAEYNFFYGNGQLHVSPHHDHDALRDHAAVPDDHTGPMAVGVVSVDGGRATWQVEGNVALRGLARVFKDYTKQVGWRWAGLTTLDGEPIDDEFAPKKSMWYQMREDKLYISAKEFSGWVPFYIQGKTARVGKHTMTSVKEAMQEWANDFGYKLADYPGGTNMLDRMHNYGPAGEDYQQYNIGDPLPNQNTSPTSEDDDRPAGTFKCPACGQLFPNWQVYMDHRRSEEPMGDEEPVQDGKFPSLDMDKTLPAHHHDHNPVVMPLASVKEAHRLDDFDLYADLWGYNTDDGHKHYGAFLNGELVGYATVREAEGDDGTEVVMVHSAIPRHGVGRALGATLQRHYTRLFTHAASPQGERLAKRLGMVNTSGQLYKWAAGMAPKDMIDDPVPFVYDVDKDQIAIGHPGQRTSDIPGEFTPGGIVEGTYQPGGKVVVNTMTNIPWTTRHLIDLWYWSHPQMEVTGVEMQDAAGNTTKLAKISRTDVGTYIKTLAMTDPAVWNAYQALRREGGHVYVVGGAVRDALLQKEPKDIDLMVAGVPPETVQHVLDNLPGRVDLTGKNFGVYRYRNKGHEVEIALPRTERSTGDRRVDFHVDVDHDLPVEDDLLRRDFTVNAMAVDLDNGRLVDPYGGADDLEARRLRTTHPSSFAEDPTRLIRALVMNARYGLTPDEDTRQQIAEHGDRLPLESADAKQPIIEKLFSSKDPARAIRLAQGSGILKHIFPEVAHNFDFDQNNPHHSYKLGDHLLNVLENTASQSTDPDLRLAALLHDIGKPASAWQNPDTGFNHYYRGPQGQGDNHEVVGADMAESRLRDLRWPVGRIKRIKHLINNHMFPAFSSSKGARKFLQRAGDEHADDLLTLRWADQHGKGQSPEELAARTSVDQQRGLVEQARSVQAPTSQSALAINGNDLIALGIKPGPAIGRILRQLTDDVVEDPNLNDPEILKERAQEYVNAMPVS